MNKKAMLSSMRARCKKLRIASRQGICPVLEDMTFLESCYAKYPDEYKAIGQEVFEETRPFGCEFTD